MGWALALVSVGVSAAGTAMSYSASKKSAAQSAQIASYNYEADTANAELAMLSGMASAQIQSQMAAYQATLAEYEAEMAAVLHELDAHEYRTEAKNYEALAKTEQNTIKSNIALTRQDFEALKSSQSAAVAKSNVVQTGTPLDVAVKTAGEMEAAVQTMLYESELKQRELFYAADTSYYSAQKSRFMADQSREAGAMQAAGHMMEAEAASFGAETAKLQYVNDLRAAEIARLTGVNQSDNYNKQATASLLSGLGSATMGGYNAIK